MAAIAADSASKPPIAAPHILSADGGCLSLALWTNRAASSDGSLDCYSVPNEVSNIEALLLLE